MKDLEVNGELFTSVTPSIYAHLLRFRPYNQMTQIEKDLASSIVKDWDAPAHDSGDDVLSVVNQQFLLGGKVPEVIFQIPLLKKYHRIYIISFEGPDNPAIICKENILGPNEAADNLYMHSAWKINKAKTLSYIAGGGGGSWVGLVYDGAQYKTMLST